jgi:hypothetical protein
LDPGSGFGTSFGFWIEEKKAIVRISDEEETFQTGANGDNRAIAACTPSPLPLLPPVQ